MVRHNISAIFIVVLLFAGFVYAVSIDEKTPWHPLQQISRSLDDKTSVDENGDGIIDHTNAPIDEILANGNVASLSLTINNLLTAKNLDVTESASIASANIEEVTITTGTVVDTLSVNTLNAVTATITTFSANTVTADSITSNGDVSASNGEVIGDRLCLVDESQGNTVVCIDTWEDLLDLLFGTV